jgi:hypothetical protein
MSAGSSIEDLLYALESAMQARIRIEGAAVIVDAEAIRQLPRLADAVMREFFGEDQPDPWQPIETAPADAGAMLVWLEKPMLGSRIHAARWASNVKTVGGMFHFDAPKATHWRPMIEGPKETLDGNRPT